MLSIINHTLMIYYGAHSHTHTIHTYKRILKLWVSYQLQIKKLIRSMSYSNKQQQTDQE